MRILKPIPDARQFYVMEMISCYHFNENMKHCLLYLCFVGTPLSHLNHENGEHNNELIFDYHNIALEMETHLI